MKHKRRRPLRRLLCAGLAVGLLLSLLQSTAYGEGELDTTESQKEQVQNADQEITEESAFVESEESAPEESGSESEVIQDADATDEVTLQFDLGIYAGWALWEYDWFYIGDGSALNKSYLDSLSSLITYRQAISGSWALTTSTISMTVGSNYTIDNPYTHTAKAGDTVSDWWPYPENGTAEFSSVRLAFTSNTYYCLVGWTTDNGTVIRGIPDTLPDSFWENETDGTIVLTAMWAARTSCTIQYYIQNEDGSYPTSPNSRENKSSLGVGTILYAERLAESYNDSNQTSYCVDEDITDSTLSVSDTATSNTYNIYLKESALTYQVDTSTLTFAFSGGSYIWNPETLRYEPLGDSVQTITKPLTIQNTSQVAVNITVAWVADPETTSQITGTLSLDGTAGDSACCTAEQVGAGESKIVYLTLAGVPPAGESTAGSLTISLERAS